MSHLTAGPAPSHTSRSVVLLTAPPSRGRPPNRWWVDPGLFETADTGNSGNSPEAREAYDGLWLDRRSIARHTLAKGTLIQAVVGRPHADHKRVEKRLRKFQELRKIPGHHPWCQTERVRREARAIAEESASSGQGIAVSNGQYDNASKGLGNSVAI
jgi:hypothetical protein